MQKYEIYILLDPLWVLSAMIHCLSIFEKLAMEFPYLKVVDSGKNTHHSKQLWPVKDVPLAYHNNI